VDACIRKVRAGSGRLLVETPLGTYAVDRSPSALMSLAEKLAEACGGDMRELYNRLREAAGQSLYLCRACNYMKMKRVVVRLPEDLIRRVDRLVEAGVFDSRSDAVEAALRLLLIEEALRTGGFGGPRGGR
jgi:hypothetical protein